MTTETETDPPIIQSRMARIAKCLGDAAHRSLDVMKLMTERLMGLLRLFATVGLTLIVSLVVYKAIQSADVVVVKPFAVPKAIQEINPDSGRIIATQLDIELKDAELLIYDTIKNAEQAWQGRSRSNADELTQITGSAADFLLGSNIKLPETGISINDVVEFISSVFGRRNIIGSVYQDQGKLHLRVELGSEVFAYERSLEGGREKALNFDLIQQMLEESRSDLLSAASPQHNLYYYCSGKTERVLHQDSRFTQWFDYCAQLKNPQGDIEDLTQLIDTLELLNAEREKATDGSLILGNVLSNALADAHQKLQPICPDYEKTKVCDPSVQVAAAESPSMPAPVEVANSPAIISFFTQDDDASVAPSTLPAPSVAYPEDDEPAEIVVAPSIMTANPVAADNASTSRTWIAVEELRTLWSECATRQITSAEVLASNQTESEGTFLFNNNVLQPAVEKYREALQQNCRNAFAWANLGVLLTGQYQAETAVFALETAMSLNSRADWIPNSLCIAQAYNDKPERMLAYLTQAKPSDPCSVARRINPANRIVMDRQFYLAVAERFFTLGNYAQAADTYQQVVSVDKKRDCTTSKVVNRLYTLTTKHQVKGAWQAACAIRDSAVPLLDGKVSSCEPELVALQCPATQ
ncbi:tetratricopeptide repeat protein [Candidatus Thiothrix anitrata]|uniref:Tetratricopeptide repeat protein n=1 Tax=Candidatus Thiothrix anitrata TaxID=2823902 RepID=A0ABX7X753_9GAMM|nr:hypothetical protein [Candidatus Thiothrix anitrata]QTR50613.1 hypothetical protein J8380_03320 [Candidatus Thiothrix anitrata]